MTFTSNIQLSSNPDDLKKILADSGISFKAGRHTIYIHNVKDIDTINPGITRIYPGGIGLKIIYSTQLTDDGTVYYSSRRTNATIPLSAKAVGSIREKMVISNILSLSGMAPKVYDIISLKHNDVWLQAMVVENICGSPVHGRKGVDFLDKFLERLKEEDIELITGKTITQDGFKRLDIDLTPPSFNNNIIENEKGAVYVDIQNFRLNKKDSLAKIMPRIKEETHFGGGRLLRGKKYNYQTIPFLGIPGKRDMEKRFRTIAKVFSSKGCISKRSVLDIGCNLGMFAYYFLSEGALWYTGLDRPEIIKLARRFLLTVGCSRFDLTGCDLNSGDISASLPKRKYDILLFLAISHHIGFPVWMDNIDFDYLVYEGEARQSIDVAKGSVLKRFGNAEIIFEGSAQDGDCHYRPLIILKMNNQE